MGRYLAGSDIGVPVLGLRPTRAGRKWSEKLAKPRISIRPPPTRHAAIWSSIIFTGSSTSRSTIWDCSCAIRWISWDFVIGPLSRVRCGAATLGATRRLQPSVSLALRTTCREVHRTAHPAHIRSAPRSLRRRKFSWDSTPHFAQIHAHFWDTATDSRHFGRKSVRATPPSAFRSVLRRTLLGQICHTGRQRAFMHGGTTDVGSSHRRHCWVAVRGQPRRREGLRSIQPVLHVHG